MQLFMLRTSFRRYAWIAATVIICIVTFTTFSSGIADPVLPKFSFSGRPSDVDATLDALSAAAQNIAQNSLPSSAFGKLGAQTAQLVNLTKQADSLSAVLKPGEYDNLTKQINEAILTLYPFIRNPLHPNDPTPFTTLRQTIVAGSQGIVIPVGVGQVRYAAHLIGNLRDVLGSQLPIQIVYAGEEDLPAKYRDILVSLGKNIETLDVLEVFDDTTLKLRESGWAIKPFAVLATKFEQVILMDADAVFMQKPEVILDEHSGYLSTGALFFHDRLLWKNVFKERAKWWRTEMGGREPSAALLKSKVWTEGYAEEGDSGVVVMDKRRTDTTMGLLHICWQNTKAVREEWTYKMTYGDKESWWFGLELTSVLYAFEEHYGAVLGEIRSEGNDDKVCGFSIAHVGEHERLLWFNGSLLKNKAVNQTEFWTPQYWMIDFEWLKGASKSDMSCMHKGRPRTVDPDVIAILERSITWAREFDARFFALIES